MDPSIYRNLLFLAAEMPNGRVDCGAQGVRDSVSKDRFTGVRIFDISDIDHPKQIAAVQTCRGAHTQTLVVDPNDKANIYIYGSGTFAVRSPNELAGMLRSAGRQGLHHLAVPHRRHQGAAGGAAECAGRQLSADFRRLRQNRGSVDGRKSRRRHADDRNHRPVSRHHRLLRRSVSPPARAPATASLIDISKPSAPRRVAAVSDVNFAYWHSATFNNDGTTVVFTDEWGGGQAAHCLATDRPEWGADAIFKVSGHTLTPASYFKLPAAQTAQENCVAHNGSLVPVPGRDILVQAWYQGGISVVDFTDAAHPKEIAFFDRGPVDSTRLVSFGGSWGAYWYNGHIVSSEIARGIDILSLRPSEHLSQNEIDAANLVRFDVFNPQNQPKIVWPAALPCGSRLPRSARAK